MSEYQYYEFKAIDRPLTQDEQKALRAVSSRAAITATGFTNEYNWGDFKGNPDRWMERYFDAFLYLANWGTRTVKLRVPKHHLGRIDLSRYADGGYLHAADAGANLVLTFNVDELHENDWYEGQEGILASLAPIRRELATGDLRSLYLGWLLTIDHGYPEEGDFEPPVPAGLNDLTEAQKALVSFFHIHEDLLAAAAEGSPARTETEPDRAKIEAWVAQASAKEKDEYLVRLIEGEDPMLATDLLVRATRSDEEAPAAETGRTAAELLRRADEIGEVRKLREVKERAEELARREREAAAAREKHLKGLLGKEDRLWEQVAELATHRKGTTNKEALRILIDLRDLGQFGGRDDFEETLEAFRLAHAKMPGLLKRIAEAGL
ncbi:MAG: hypothetical protein ACO1SV_14535 [Fimbriimonas sp.]